MANQQQVDMLLRDGVEVWNRWRADEPTIQPDLNDADLSQGFISNLYGELDFQSLDLSRVDLSGANLNGANLSRVDLSGANLRWANLSGANLTEARLEQANLNRAALRAAKLNEANIMGAELRSAQLVEADLSNTQFTAADMTYANLTNAQLAGVSLFGVCLSHANLTGANLVGADLTGAELIETVFSHANLTRARLDETICVRTDFSYAKLVDCTVSAMSACDVNLEGAIQADLSMSDSGRLHAIIDNIETAQFLSMLRNEKVLAHVDAIACNVVLILASFSDERKPILDGLREALRRHSHGYIPVVVGFSTSDSDAELETVVRRLTYFARFVIADLSESNAVLNELAYISRKDLYVPIQRIIQRGARLPTEHPEYTDFSSINEYADLSHLLAILSDSVIAPIEKAVDTRGASNIYLYRYGLDRIPF